MLANLKYQFILCIRINAHQTSHHCKAPFLATVWRSCADFMIFLRSFIDQIKHISDNPSHDHQSSSCIAVQHIRRQANKGKAPRVEASYLLSAIYFWDSSRSVNDGEDFFTIWRPRPHDWVNPLVTLVTGGGGAGAGGEEKEGVKSSVELKSNSNS